MTDIHTHPDYLALLRAIHAAPDDDLPRIVLADWLDERAGATACPRCEGRTTIDMPNRADEARYKVVGYKDTHPYLPIAIAECPRCHGTGRVGDGLAERGEFIRLQCDLARDPLRADCRCPNCTDPAGRQTVCAVVRREFELFSHYCRTWHPNPTGGRAEWQWRLPGTPENGNGSWVYSRGFVSTVRGPLAALWRPCGRCKEAERVAAARGTVVGCCDRYADNKPCDCPATHGEDCPDCRGRSFLGALAALGPEVLCVGRVEVTDREPAAEDYLNTLTNEEGTDWVWREDNGHLAMDRPRQIPGWLFDHIDLPKMRDFPTLKVAASPAIARATLSAAVLTVAYEPWLLKDR